MNNVELIFLKSDFSRFKTLMDFISLTWTERYYGVGEFSLYVDKRYMQAAFAASYIFRKDSGYTGLIEYREVDNEKGRILIKGRFLESMLNTRVINLDLPYEGKAEAVARSLVQDFCISGERAIDNLYLGAVRGLGENVICQRYGKTVFEAVTELLQAAELGFCIRYDLYAGKMFFEVFQGLDRTQTQNINDWCIFSSKFYNILSEKYTNTVDYRNFAYVEGIDEDGKAYIVEVDLTMGLPRRELFVNAGDLRKTKDTDVEFYEKTLVDRGISKLQEYTVLDSVECEIDLKNAMLFALGDKCTYVEPELGLLAEGRITEIAETIEDGARSRSIILGREQLNIIQKIKRDGN